MPGKMGASSGRPACSRNRAIRFSRISSFTRREARRLSENEEARNSPNVRALLMAGTPGGTDFPALGRRQTLGGLYAGGQLPVVSYQLPVFGATSASHCSFDAPTVEKRGRRQEKDQREGFGFPDS